METNLVTILSFFSQIRLLNFTKLEHLNIEVHICEGHEYLTLIDKVCVKSYFIDASFLNCIRELIICNVTIDNCSGYIVFKDRSRYIY